MNIFYSVGALARQVPSVIASWIEYFLDSFINRENDSDSDYSDEEITNSDSDSDLDNLNYKSNSTMDRNMTVDAVGSERHGLFPTKDITFSDLSSVENSLDFDEKVSVAFLLYDDPAIALQDILLIRSGAQKSILIEWTKSNKSTFVNWKDKLIEVFSLIQNYAVLRKLGFSRSEVDARFLPHNTNTSLFVNIVKKILYHLCESLNLELTKTFISSLQLDYKQKMGNEFNTFNVENLEFVFLTLLNDKYISINNMTNILKALKTLQLEYFYDKLKEYSGSVGDNINSVSRQFEYHSWCSKQESNEYLSNSQSRNYRIDQNIGAETLSINSDLSRRSSVNAYPNYLPHIDKKQKQTRTDDCYEINENSPGICLIFNQEVFYSEPEESLQYLLPPEKFENRKGTNKDKELLDTTFRKFGFLVHVEDNKTHLEILQILKDVIQNIGDHSSLFVCILSHGAEGKIYGSNSIPLEIKEIEEIMCKENLRDLSYKPKVLVVQACQGHTCHEVFPVNETNDNKEDSLAYDGPSKAIAYLDMLTFCATIPGFSAIRDMKNGTWFIQSLCHNILKNYDRYHFQDICTLVENEVTNKRWGTKVMVPLKKSTFTKFFYLPQIKSD